MSGRGLKQHYFDSVECRQPIWTSSHYGTWSSETQDCNEVANDQPSVDYVSMWPGMPYATAWGIFGCCMHVSIDTRH